MAWESSSISALQTTNTTIKKRFGSALVLCLLVKRIKAFQNKTKTKQEAEDEEGGKTKSLTLPIGSREWRGPRRYLFFLLYVIRWPVEKPEKNPNNALDFGLRASIFEVIISFLPTSTKGRAAQHQKKENHGTKTWLGHGILLVCVCAMNAKLTAQLFTFICKMFFAPLFSSSFLPCGGNRKKEEEKKKRQVVHLVYDWVLGYPTNKVSQ